jgi:hypothetical protein
MFSVSKHHAWKGMYYGYGFLFFMDIYRDVGLLVC